MKNAAFALTLVAAVLLPGCQNQPEETPDITEAIPLDNPEDSADATIDDVEPTPEAGIDTMESGSNPPGTTSPPPGSKVQPAD